MGLNELYLVKLGGSVITDKTRPYTLRLEVLDRLLEEVSTAFRDGLRIVLGHGGGSFPHVSASMYSTHKGFINRESRLGMAKVHRDAATLNMIIVDRLINKGVYAFPIQPSAIILAEDGQPIDSYLETLEYAIDSGMLPVIYGDVVFDRVRGCTILSTEEIFRVVGLSLRDKYKVSIIMVEDVDGVYDRDPRMHREAELIRLIDRNNINKVLEYLAGSHGIDVTGGMRSKIEILYGLASNDIESFILNGLIGGRLLKYLRGERVPGTLVKY